MKERQKEKSHEWKVVKSKSLKSKSLKSKWCKWVEMGGMIFRDKQTYNKQIEIQNATNRLLIL